MADMELITNSDKLAEAFLKAPVQLEKNIDRAINSVMYPIARTAREKAPKAFTTLAIGIQVHRPSTLEGIVAPSSNYAEDVERGTGIYGPAGTPSGKMPPVQNILDWAKVIGLVPQQPGETLRQTAYAIARHIATTGTRPHPYMEPALEEHANDASRGMNAAIDKTLREL